MGEETNDNNEFKSHVLSVSDPRLYELLFTILQDAQAAGSVVQIITIWPSSAGVARDGVVHPTKCSPTGVCPK